MRPGGLNLHRSHYANGNGTAIIRHYREYMESVAKYFGANASTAAMFSQETLAFEIALFQVSYSIEDIEFVAYPVKMYYI